jgi:4'-phosphopantetheinyl transferase
MNGEEQGRARRFAHDRDRHSFVAAHGGLRLLLAAMRDASPASVEFSADPFGKPRLVRSGGVEFNMSHSGGIVLIGFARDMAVGVDVEARRPMSDRSQIVRRYFHPGEVADFADVPDDQAEDAFFRCWSRKEAVVKALGLGMSLDLHRYRVTCMPGAAPELLALEGEIAPHETWSIVDIDPGSNYVGAVAVRRRPLAVDCLTFDPAGALR